MQGFDCSGFIQWVLQSVGVDPKGDQTAQVLHDLLLQQGGIPIPMATAGAIAFYGQTPKRISHVSMCLNEHQIIEAGGGGSTTTSVEAATKIGACVRVRPFTDRKDRVALVMPNYPLWVTNG